MLEGHTSTGLCSRELLMLKTLGYNKFRAAGSSAEDASAELDCRSVD